jgi:hypothetical protein
MIDIFNGTQVVSAVAASGLANFLAAALTIFGAAIVATIILVYFHHKHIEGLAEQIADTTSMAVQSIQSMVTLAIAAEQGMDITDKVIGKPSPSAEKKAQ